MLKGYPINTNLRLLPVARVLYRNMELTLPQSGRKLVEACRQRMLYPLILDYSPFEVWI